MKQKIFYDFVEAINKHSTADIYDLMADDHKFIDAQGNEMAGKSLMQSGWKSYFDLFPDYRIEVSDIFEKDNVIAAFGSASGSYKGDGKQTLNLPAAWKAIIEEIKVKLWQVYADTKIPFEIISKNQSK